MFEIYKSQYNPVDFTGQVGGNIGSEVLSGYVNELFQHVTSPPSGVNETAYQYRKIFIKNTYITASTHTRVWIDAIEHPEQITMDNSSGLADTTYASTGEPVGVTGWNTTTNYDDALSIGTLNPNAYTGVWLRQSLSGIDIPDPYATFRIYVGGVI